MSKVNEVWKATIVSELHEISNLGNVRKILKQGYKYLKGYTDARHGKALVLVVNGKIRPIHTLMIGVWVKPCNDTNKIIYHKNGIVTDNNVNNIGWITRKELGKKIGGKTIRVAVIQIDLITGEELNWYNSYSAAAKDTYICRKTISDAARGKIKEAGGYRWRLDRSESI